LGSGDPSTENPQRANVKGLEPSPLHETYELFNAVKE
jgi:hypothetical protein